MYSANMSTASVISDINFTALNSLRSESAFKSLLVTACLNQRLIFYNY